jgi:hypothetical protein
MITADDARAGDERRRGVRRRDHRRPPSALVRRSAEISGFVGTITDDRRADQPAGAERRHRGRPAPARAARASPSSPTRSASSAEQSAEAGRLDERDRQRHRPHDRARFAALAGEGRVRAPRSPDAPSPVRAASFEGIAVRAREVAPRVDAITDPPEPAASYAEDSRGRMTELRLAGRAPSSATTQEVAASTAGDRRTAGTARVVRQGLDAAAEALNGLVVQFTTA